MACCKKNSGFCLMLTLFRCPLITENKHLLRDPELSSVTRNCQICIMPLDTLKIGIYKLKDFMNCIKIKRNNLFNSIYSSVSPDFCLKETPFVNFFTDPELSSSLYIIVFRNKNNPTYFHFFALKTDNLLFCHRDIPTIHNGYCVSNTVDYAKKNDVLPTICKLN